MALAISSSSRQDPRLIWSGVLSYLPHCFGIAANLADLACVQYR